MSSRQYWLQSNCRSNTGAFHHVPFVQSSNATFGHLNDPLSVSGSCLREGCSASMACCSMGLQAAAKQFDDMLSHCLLLVCHALAIARSWLPECCDDALVCCCVALQTAARHCDHPCSQSP
jgi:hypothetical protein